MKPERWCCICERYILDTDEQVRANELVAHETCYLRAKKFFDSRDPTSSENHPCEVAVGLSVADLRATASLESEKRRAAEESRARRLREKGLSVSEIGRIMGKNESSVRSLLQDARRPDERVEQ